MNRRSFLKTLSFFAASGLVNPKNVLASLKDEVTHQVGPQPKVIRVFAKDATNWDYKTQPYFKYINYEAVKSMFSAGITALSGTGSAHDAWKKILGTYKKGEKIVVKPNLNNTGIGYANAIMTSPQVFSAVLESLIESGFPEKDIIFYDLSARLCADISPWLARFPVEKVFMRDLKNLKEKIAARLFHGLQDADPKARIKMRSTIRDDDGAIVDCYIPNVLTRAHHLINIPVFKAHQFILQSGALKNHFGTVRFSNYSQYPVALHGDNIEKNIVDINSNDHIRLKTKIIIADALFGAGCFLKGANNRLPTKWKTLASGPTPSSLFFSFDPVALDSVLADYIIREQKSKGYETLSHQYLHDAMDMKLGIHEHSKADGNYMQIKYEEVLT